MMSTRTESKNKLLHIYPQYAHHTDAILVGNREGLTALRSALNKVLNMRILDECEAQAEEMVNDGEGYKVIVIKNNNNWQSEFWSRLPTPYADYASDEDGETINLYDYIVELRTKKGKL